VQVHAAPVRGKKLCVLASRVEADANLLGVGHLAWEVVRNNWELYSSREGIMDQGEGELRPNYGRATCPGVDLAMLQDSTWASSEKTISAQ